jgi:DNA-binding response OmpR family regulator
MLDLNQRSAQLQERVLKLSPIAFKLLEVLVRASPQTVSRQHILQAVWGDDQPDSNSLKVHIHHVRKQLDASMHSPLLKLETIPGIGFAIKEAVPGGLEVVGNKNNEN